jgi:energy-coupling factor transport system ATP-binding protein
VPEHLLYRSRAVEEVAVTLRARGRDGAEALALLEELGIGSLAPRHPREVSAGQRLLIAVAAVVATGAPALLLDEPTRGLDPEAKGRLSELLRRFAARGGGAVVATHDVELAAALATRVVLLAGGEVIADGSPAEVLADSPVFSPEMTRVFGPGWLTPEQVARALGA